MKFDIDTLNKYAENTIVCVEKHPDADLYIYGYYSDIEKPCVWDRISIHCRGLIVDGKGNVIEHPFKKFWTYKQYLNKYTVLLNDDQIRRIPEGKFRILEKVDGTMCTLYWINDKPFLATQRSFTNSKAMEATKILYEKHSGDIHKLDKKYTYIFEAVYPESNVLIDYGDTRDLYLIGMIDKQTCMPMELPDIGFLKARDYTSQYGSITNFDELAALNIPNQEGFVIYFGNGEMFKIKFPWYQEAHSLLDSIIDYHKRIYHKQKVLRNILNLQEIRISNIEVWRNLANGDYELCSLRSQIPRYYYLMGFESWLSQVKNDILGKTDAEEIKNWDSIRPQQEEIFDIEYRFEHPHVYESIVINWKERYLKS